MCLLFVAQVGVMAAEEVEPRFPMVAIDEVLRGLRTEQPMLAEPGHLRGDFLVPLDLSEGRRPDIEIVRVIDPDAFELTVPELDRRPFRLEIEQLTRVETDQFLVRPGEWTVIREVDAVVAPFVLGAQPQHLPEVVYFVDETVSAAPTVRQFHPVIALAEAPMPWRHEDQAYGTDLFLRLDPPLGQEGVVGTPIDPAVNVIVSTRGLAIAGGRHEVQVDTFGHAVRIPLRAVDHRDGPRHVDIVFPWESRYTADVDVSPRLDSLTVRVQAARPFGFGLETVPFTVVRLAEDGHPLVAPRPEPMNVEAQGVNTQFLQPGLRVEAESSQATGNFRGVGAGRMSFVVSEGGVTSEPVEVLFVWPWIVIILAAVGGGAGAAVLQHRQDRAGSLAAELVIGAFIGLLVVAGAALGLVTLSVEIDPGAATTATGALVIGAAGGFLGRQALAWIAHGLGLGRAMPQV